MTTAKAKWDTNVRTMRALAGLHAEAEKLRAEVSLRALDRGAAESEGVPDDLYAQWLTRAAQHIGQLRIDLIYIQEAMVQGTYDAVAVRRTPRFLMGQPPAGVMRIAEGESSAIVARVNILHWAVAQVTRQPIKRAVR